MVYWNHGLWSDETKIELFGSDGLRYVWQRPGEECVRPTVKHGGANVMVYMYGEILQQTMIPSLQNLGPRVPAR